VQSQDEAHLLGLLSWPWDSSYSTGHNAKHSSAKL